MRRSKHVGPLARCRSYPSGFSIEAIGLVAEPLVFRESGFVPIRRLSVEPATSTTTEFRLIANPRCCSAKSFIKRKRKNRQPNQIHRFEPLKKRQLLAASFGTNSLQTLDVDRGGTIEPLDALLVINALRRQSPIIAASLPNDTAGVDQLELVLDLITKDDSLDLQVTFADGGNFGDGLGDQPIFLQVGGAAAEVNIQGQFANSRANLTASDVDAAFGSPLPEGDHEVNVRIENGDAIKLCTDCRPGGSDFASVASLRIVSGTG